MDRKEKTQWASYWKLAWKERPRVKSFSVFRAIPSILVSIAQFAWKHNTRSSLTEMWIAIAIIIAVYLVLSTLEAIRNFVVISPVKIHSQQSETIAELNGENTKLKATLSSPEWSQEQRKRDAVREMLARFSDAGKEIIRFILDNGDTPLTTLRYDRFGKGIYEKIQMAKNLNLVQERTSEKKTILTINPEFKDALGSLLSEKAP
jgi:hypothetical protein